ncbi:MAG: cobalt-precorrin-5B (C(1))-methyltransferase [Nitrospirae bacterium CG_4_8_14_3_um_filter_44_28]|nr:MAG: cobalt-precorrin-5B (C(1))-methyltransferase [Nitrospirae bacterium CG_4_8_14_3_um_filter_44_28]
MASKNKKLRSGYTTGACAAAAAKAATMILLSGKSVNRLIGKSQNKQSPPIHPFTHSPIYREIEIPFPDGSRHKFKIQDSRFKDGIAAASTIKDAGDDPDVTNGAEIRAEARIINNMVRQSNGETEIFAHSPIHPFTYSPVIIRGGKGVGKVTKPGLQVPVGESAINPVPRKMIKEAVMEAIIEQKSRRAEEQQSKAENTTALLHYCTTALEITISVPDGEELAKKTLNSRLGIINGISILGTTGIVKPISAEAWTATITSSMDVAKAMGRSDIVLSAGRASEKAHINKFKFPEESYVMMGDYLEFALFEAKKHGFKKIHLCAQWAKMLKIAMATPQTHVRHGAIDLKKAVEFLKGLGAGDWELVQDFNTAMEIFEFISASRITHHASLFLKVCAAAKKYAEGIAKEIPVDVYLVSYEGEIIADSE